MSEGEIWDAITNGKLQDIKQIAQKVYEKRTICETRFNDMVMGTFKDVLELCKIVCDNENVKRKRRDILLEVKARMSLLPKQETTDIFQESYPNDIFTKCLNRVKENSLNILSKLGNKPIEKGNLMYLIDETIPETEYKEYLKNLVESLIAEKVNNNDAHNFISTNTRQLLFESLIKSLHCNINNHQRIFPLLCIHIPLMCAIAKFDSIKAGIEENNIRIQLIEPDDNISLRLLDYINNFYNEVVDVCIKYVGNVDVKCMNHEILTLSLFEDKGTDDLEYYLQILSKYKHSNFEDEKILIDAPKLDDDIKKYISLQENEKGEEGDDLKYIDYFPSLNYLLGRCSQIICINTEENKVEDLLKIFSTNSPFGDLFKKALMNEIERRTIYESGWWTQKSTQFASKQTTKVNNLFELTYETAWIMFNRIAESRSKFVNNIISFNGNGISTNSLFFTDILHYPSQQTEGLFLYIKTLVNLVPDPPSIKYLEALAIGATPPPISHLISIEPDRTIEANLLRLLQIRCAVALIGKYANNKLISSCNGLAYYLAFNGQIRSHPDSVIRPLPNSNHKRNLHRLWRYLISEMAAISHITDPSILISEKYELGINNNVIVTNNMIAHSYLKGVNSAIKKIEETSKENTDIQMTHEFLDIIEKTLDNNNYNEEIEVYGMKICLPVV